jgi:hypothetical protein
MFAVEIYAAVRRFVSLMAIAGVKRRALLD